MIVFVDDVVTTNIISTMLVVSDLWVELCRFSWFYFVEIEFCFAMPFGFEFCWFSCYREMHYLMNWGWITFGHAIVNIWFTLCWFSIFKSYISCIEVELHFAVLLLLGLIWGLSFVDLVVLGVALFTLRLSSILLGHFLLKI